MSQHRRHALDLRPMPKHREPLGHRVAFWVGLGSLLTLILFQVFGVIR